MSLFRLKPLSIEQARRGWRLPHGVPGENVISRLRSRMALVANLRAE